MAVVSVVLVLVLLVSLFCNTNSDILSNNDPQTSVAWIATTLDKSKQFEKQNDLTVQSGSSSQSTKLTIDTSTLMQNMYGYGAALTQSTAYLLTEYKNMDESKYWTLMNQLFNQSLSLDGSIAINVLRYPMGASDFTLPNINYFSYDDTYWDFQLSQLSLANAEKYQIPILKDVLSINPDIKVMLCPWSAPAWLKTSSAAGYPGAWEAGQLNETGNNMQVYSDYFVEVINLYRSQHGISFFAISMQNEPLNCPNDWIVMCMSAQTQIKFLNMLAFNIRSNVVGYRPKIMIYDHNWDVTDYAITVLSNSEAYNNTDFTAWHCYGGDVSAQSVVYKAFPDKEQIFTECSGFGGDDFAGNMKWDSQNIWYGSIMNHGSLVTHWNLVLDQENGPHNNGCANCRGCIQFDTNNNFEIEYFEEYFGIGHYGKWVDSKIPAKVVESSMDGGNGCVTGIAFKNDESAKLAANQVIVVVNNFCDNTVTVGVQQSNQYFEADVPPGISSFLW